MFNNLSDEVKSILEYMEKNPKEIYGTNDLLWALVNIKNSMMKIILDDYKIEVSDINEYIANTICLSYEDGKYTKKLLEVIEFATEIASKENEEVYEEHLVYAILKVKDTIAYSVLKYYLNDIEHLASEYSLIFDLEETSSILVNLTKKVKSNPNKFIGRLHLVDKVINTLSKKKKANPMLIGSAGVGKSSVVEEVARVLLKKKPEYTIYQLDVSSILAGTKYRGDLEEKLLDILEKVKRPYTVLFIDEIHNIMTKSDEAQQVDIGNIIKPILSRGEINLIGATTLDEYYKTINNDKALARRFTNIFIDEASQSETFQILKGIKKEYEKHYNVKYSDKVLKYIILKSNLITNRYFPDKAIDILDEAGLEAKKDRRKEVTIEDVDIVTFSLIGQDINKIKDNLNQKIKFPKLKYYINNYLLGIIEQKTIGRFKVSNEETLKELISELKQIFNLKDEMILEVNMSRYKTSYELSNLFGSAKGYVGYSSGGLISEHLNKYPFNVLIIKNLSEANNDVKLALETIINEGGFIDNKSRKISLRNTIIILLDKTTSSTSLGFISDKTKKEELYYDEEFNLTDYNYYEEMLELLNNFTYHNYHFTFLGSYLTKETFEKIKNQLLDINNYQKNKDYVIDTSGNFI